ncbi:MAG: hypothetical protein ACHREM_08650 [Polyangiales bacterium]
MLARNEDQTGTDEVLRDVTADDNGTFLLEPMGDQVMFPDAGFENGGLHLFTTNTKGALVKLADVADEQDGRLALGETLVWMLLGDAAYSVPRTGGVPTKALSADHGVLRDLVVVDDVPYVARGQEIVRATTTPNVVAKADATLVTIAKRGTRWAWCTGSSAAWIR